MLNPTLVAVRNFGGWLTSHLRKRLRRTYASEGMKSEVGTVFIKLVIFDNSTEDFSDSHPSSYQPSPTAHYFGHGGPLIMLRWTDGNRCFSVMQALVRLPPCFISITSANAKHIQLLHCWCHGPILSLVFSLNDAVEMTELPQFCFSLSIEVCSETAHKQQQQTWELSALFEMIYLTCRLV